MDTIGIVCSIIAAFGSIITVAFSYLMWRDSKRNLLNRIDKKKNKISTIDNHIFLKFGSGYSRRGVVIPLEEKKRRLQLEIDYLKKLL